MDSATSPSAPRRMTGWGAYCEGWEFSDQRTQPKGNLLLCALNLDGCYVHWYWVDALCIGFGLTLGKLIFDWFMSLIVNKGNQFLPFGDAHFNELVFFQSLTPPSCHSARRACPQLQNPLFNKRRKPSLFLKRYPPNGWGREKVSLSGPHPLSATVPPLPED